MGPPESRDGRGPRPPHREPYVLPNRRGGAAGAHPGQSGRKAGGGPSPERPDFWRGPSGRGPELVGPERSPPGVSRAGEPQEDEGRNQDHVAMAPRRGVPPRRGCGPEPGRDRSPPPGRGGLVFGHGSDAHLDRYPGSGGGHREHPFGVGGSEPLPGSWPLSSRPGEA